jgi:metal-responsive CopG/Arc/MetJ family transcriptional regulator
MQQQTARINVTLPKELIESVNQITGPRSRSRLIAESLREHIRQIKKDELEKQLEEGYRTTAKESIVLAHEFEAADLEGWDEY